MVTTDILKLPKRVRDPTHTTKLQQRYRKEIRQIFDEFKQRITPIIDRVLRQHLEMSAISDIDPEIDDQINMIIHAKSKTTIKKNITLSYRRGKQTSSDNPRIRRMGLTIPYEISIIDQEIIRDLELRNFNLVKGATGDMKANMLRVMDEGIRQHKGIRAIARDMRREINQIVDRRADLIAQTETAHSYNTAVSKSYQDAGIKQWQWMAALGERTCPVCEANHGQVFNWGDEQPPIHPRCLCTIYPVVNRPFER